MVGKYKAITLCGSTHFKEQFLEAQKRLTFIPNDECLLSSFREIYQISNQGESTHFHLCLPMPVGTTHKYIYFFNTGA